MGLSSQFAKSSQILSEASYCQAEQLLEAGDVAAAYSRLDLEVAAKPLAGWEGSTQFMQECFTRLFFFLARATSQASAQKEDTKARVLKSTLLAFLRAGTGLAGTVHPDETSAPTAEEEMDTAIFDMDLDMGLVSDDEGPADKETAPASSAVAQRCASDILPLAFKDVFTHAVRVVEPGASEGDLVIESRSFLGTSAHPLASTFRSTTAGVHFLKECDAHIERLAANAAFQEQLRTAKRKLAAFLVERDILEKLLSSGDAESTLQDWICKTEKHDVT